MSNTSTAVRVTKPTVRPGDSEYESLEEAGLNEQFELALVKAEGELGRELLHRIGGMEQKGARQLEDRSPIDGRLVATFQEGSADDLEAGIAAARRGFDEWSAVPWQERVQILRQAAELIDQDVMRLSALDAIEVGKTRHEAIGDIEETSDLLRYYCSQMESNDGFIRAMGSLGDANVRTSSELRPYGVWAVISPFNFPFALAGGPTAAALLGGNGVLLKPSSDGPLLGYEFVDILYRAGVPRAALNVVTAPGSVAGDVFCASDDLDGIVFTGSYDVGFHLYTGFSRRYPRPVIVEMGGKSPVIVTKSANLDDASEGIIRSAFGYGGQKCTASSRVFAHRDIVGDLLDLLTEKSNSLTVGNPLHRDVWMGPLINEKALEKYRRATSEARRDGRIVAGGEVTSVEGGTDLYVEPTVVTDLPRGHRVAREELFVPLTVVAAYDDFEQALNEANATDYGLAAGIYSREQSEIDRFLVRIQAGIVYSNRRLGATTGGWPGVQTFGGWKGSGSTGKSTAGPNYVQQFMREQSRTIVS